MTDVQDYKIKVSPEGIDDTLAQLRSFASQATSIVKSQQQLITGGLTTPFAAATTQANALSTTIATGFGNAPGGVGYSVTLASSQLGNFSTQMAQLGQSAQQNLGSGSGGMSGSLMQAAGAIRSFTTGLTGIGLGLSAMALGKLAGSAISMWAAWQEGQLRAQLATGQTREEIEKFGETLKKTSAETGVELGTLQEKFVEFVARGNMPAKEAMELFPIAVRQARNANVDLESTLRLTTTTMATLNLSASEMPRIMDQWTKGLGPLLPEYERFFARVGPQMKIWGMDTERASHQMQVLFSRLAPAFGGGRRGGQRAGQFMAGALEDIKNTLTRTGKMMEDLAQGALKDQPLELVAATAERLYQQHALDPGGEGDIERQRFGLTPDAAGGYARIRQLKMENRLNDLENAFDENERRNELFEKTTKAALDRGEAFLERQMIEKGEYISPQGEPGIAAPEGFTGLPEGWEIKRPRKQYGGVVRGSSEGTEVVVGEGGVGHDEAIVPLGGNAGVGGEDKATTVANTTATLENTIAINRLVAIMRPLAERAAAARASVEGALATGQHFEGGGGTSGGAGAGVSAPGGPAQSAAPSVSSGAVPGASFVTSLPDAMKGDVEGRGPSGGRFNVGGRQLSPASDLTTVTLSNGQTVQVNKRVAGQFGGFFNDLIAAGAPVSHLGGIGTRPNRSQHPWGGAVDWAQSGYGLVPPNVRAWMTQNAGTLNALEKRWGMGGGEHWRNPDTGHFSIDRIYGAEHLTAAQKESAEALAGAKKMQHGGVVKAKSGGTPVVLGEGGEDEIVIPASRLAAAEAIAATETGFSAREAYSERYNLPTGPKKTRNVNVAKYGEQAADYGYYQMNAMQAAAAIKRGMPPELARHLYGGGREGVSSSSPEQQTIAIDRWLTMKYGKTYTDTASGDPAAFEKFRRAAQHEYFGLKDRPDVARAQFARGPRPELHHEPTFPPEQRPIRLSVEYPTLPPLVTPKREFAHQRFHGNTDRSITMSSLHSHSDSWFA